MEYIDINLMYMPQTYLNRKLIHFSYKKAEALFYYIAVEKMVTRDQASSMFWDDCDNETAKKNLRQSLYVLKRTFGNDVIKSLSNHMLSFSDTYTIRCDLDVFYEKRDMGLYKGEIFQGFHIKNAGTFEDWLLEKRESAKNFYLSNYLEYMKAIPSDKLNVLENYFNRYIKEAPLDEQAYIIMLQGYLKNALYHKGMQLYQKLCTLLKEELGTEPTGEITELYYTLLDNMATVSERELNLEHMAMQSSEQPCESKELVVCKPQMKMLYDAYMEHLAGKGRAVLISGENGVGKNLMISEFLDTNITKDTLVLKITCYMKNKDVMLQPWNDLMLRIQKYISQKRIDIPYNLVKAVNRLVPAFDITGAENSSTGDENYDYRASKNSVLQTLMLVARNTKLVILFESIHAMDALSLDILTSLVHTARQEIFIICSAFDVVDRDTESFISATHNNNQLIRIYLSPISFEEAEMLIRAESDSLSITDDQIREIYRHSQGNLLFIKEILWNIKNGQTLDYFSPRIHDMLNDQLNGLSEPVLKLLDVISVFLVYVALDELCFIQNENSAEISRQLDKLKERGIISEKIIEDRVCFVFNHLYMHNFIYSKIPLAKKRRLHELAGIACENASFNLENEYDLIIRHFSLGGNPAKALQYKIQKLSEEMFPDYESFVDFTKEAKSVLAPQDYLQSLFVELAAVKEQQPEALEYDRMEAVLLLAKSRCCLLNGEVEEGTEAFAKLLNQPYIWANSRFLFEANLQLMDYIVRNTDGNICMVCQRRKESIDPLERAIYYQMQAFIAILRGDEKRTRHLLNKVTEYISRSRE